MDWTPLEALPPAVEKVAGAKTPAPIKMMAARGMSPLKPGEMLTALYQLAAQTDDVALKQAAQKTANELPEPTLKGGLAEPLDVRVLDFFARRLFQKPALLEIVLLNRTTDDDTFRHLATICNETELELIARNEERLLRTPAIIAALYLNPKTRMSTAQRALELAVRNNVRVEGIAAFDEAKAAIEAEAGAPVDAAALDAAFSRAAEIVVDPMAGLIVGAVDPSEEEAQLAAEEKAVVDALAAGEEPTTEEVAEEKKKRLEDLPVAAQIRAATLGNSFARSILIRSKNKQVALACVKSPAVKDTEAMHWAANRSLDEDIIRHISFKRQWTRLYGVKVALCNNPKCPIPTAMGFLPHLRPPDLKAVSRSKGVPSAVANAAKQMLQARMKGKGA